MFGLHIADIAVILVYLIVVAGIGFWTSRFVKNLRSFVMPHRFGKLMMIMFTFGTGTHSDQAVSVASKSYTNGLSGIWYQWLWLFATPFYWLIAPVMRRFRAITSSDIFEARYHRSVGVLFAVIGVTQLAVNIGVMLKGSSAVIDACTGGMVPANMAIAIMTVLFVMYGVAGGLTAAIITDFIQGILTIVFSIILLPLVLNAVGGFSAMRETINNPEMFSLVAPGEIGAFYITIIAVNALIGIVAQPHTLGNCAAGRTEMDGRVGFMMGSYIKRFCTIAWCFTGLAAVAYYASSGLEHPDMVYGAVAREFLPNLMPGLVGLFIAALLASVMSSCDAFMIASAGLFAENIYKPLVRGKSDKHYLLVVRIASFAVVGGGVLFAFILEDVLQGLEIFWKIAPMMGIAFWLGLFWRRTTTAGAWASTLVALLAWGVSSQMWFIEAVKSLPFAESLKFVFVKESGPVIYLPWQMIFYLASGLLAGIIVSLFTKPVNKEKLDNFFALARTPVTGEEDIKAPCTLPEDIEVPEPKRLVPPVFGLEIPRPLRVSVIGFAIGWVLVGLIIGFVYILVK